MLKILFRARYFLLLLTLVAGVLLWPGVRVAVVVDNSLTVWFLKDDPALVAYQEFQATFGNDEVVVLIVRDRHSLLSPAYFRAFGEMTQAVEAIPEVESVIGPGNATVSVRSPVGLIPQPLLTPVSAPEEVKEKLGPGTQFMPARPQMGRITVFGEMVSARELTAKMDTLLRLAEGHLVGVGTVTTAGYQPMYAHIVQYVIRSQVNSLLLALLLIFLLVWLFIRQLKLALLAVVLNFFPIVLLMGVMGWAGIYLDTATASIAAIILSFCIDDTIHFIYFYQRSRRRGQAPTAARENTVNHVGPAIFLTSLVLFVGYAVMMFGSLKTVSLFGMLTAITILAALYSQLVIFPLLLEKYDRAAPVTGQKVLP